MKICKDCESETYCEHMGTCHERARMPATHTEQFDAAILRVNDERGDVYGTPLTNFTRMAAAEHVIATCPDSAVRQALYMVWNKVCRLVQSPDHLDSAIDIAGYARVVCMIVDERRALPPPPNPHDYK